ncbi:MAG: formate dehydrogenase [Thalassobium sp.]|uniref:formate dehydrogenase subunit delta n=1 Tax=Octadecabacter sp. SW4 TaxID=2602067 RepID=UPI000C0EC2BA|nr:formate dehydrogenase subunit delta [Octadecabacter sp. SW4]PHQ84183.1 MAG: formate dehydrogenase [Thalassobium sp.]QEE35282.1 formate dehydrogenase subunit delta [Octadecabacter sp. SW4]|tara:strand:- start:347 stop:562 length:216 start_codon:yes stop_codon:yes gene_type:complete
MSPEKMVMMTNQIASFFATQPDADKASRVADHLREFWEPRMLDQLYAHVDAGGAGLSPLALEGAQKLRATA